MWSRIRSTWKVSRARSTTPSRMRDSTPTRCWAAWATRRRRSRSCAPTAWFRCETADVPRTNKWSDKMSTDKILSSKADGVGTLTFNNPERRNAVSPEMSEAAAAVMEDFTNDKAVRVIVLTGAGDKAFVSGADISKFEAGRATPEQRAEWDRKSNRFRELLRDVGKPTIAKVR